VVYEGVRQSLARGDGATANGFCLGMKSG
jgi:hypothetical protein